MPRSHFVPQDTGNHHRRGRDRRAATHDNPVCCKGHRRENRLLLTDFRRTSRFSGGNRLPASTFSKEEIHTMKRPPFVQSVLRAALTICALLAALPAEATWSNRQTSQFQDRPKLQALISAYATQDVEIDEMAATPSGEWVVVAGHNVAASSGFPAFPLSKINQYVSAGAKIDVIEFAPNGSFVIIAGGARWFSSGLPKAQQLEDAINGRINSGHGITDVALTDNGFSVVSGSWAVSQGVPTAFYQAVYDRISSKRTIRGIEIGFDGGWAVYGDNFFMSNDVSPTLANAANSWMRDQIEISRLMLGLGSNYVLFGNAIFEPNFNSNIEKVEYGLDAGTKNIYEAMQEANVPGVSIAIIDDNKVVYARGYGTLEAGAQRPVLTTSPFDAASLSKFVGATTILRAIQNPANNISLVTNLQEVLDQGDSFDPLNIWRGLIENSPGAFGTPGATVPANKITFTRLLSHTASLEPKSSTEFTVWPGYEPTMAELLLGLDCDSNGCQFQYDNPVYYNPALGQPGSRYRYSGGGYLVAEAMIEKILGDQFEDIAQDLVLGPLGMEDSTYVQPMSPSFEARAAQQHDDGALKTRAYYPWNAAGGLYSSAKDYAEVVIPFMNGGYTSKGEDFLNPIMVAQALTDRDPGSKRWGIGMALSAQDGDGMVDEEDADDWFSHNGCHNRRARNWMIGSPARDQGIVVLVNNEDGSCSKGDGQKVRQMIGKIRVAFECAYGWTTKGTCM
ncbi:MAG: beta-lactamase family protein [Acidobacteria bacterium]|nr:beta-lactamase family protein [Acidobacteriota bacterium]